MRCSLNLHLRYAHEKPQQPNQFDSPTDPDEKIPIRSKYLFPLILLVLADSEAFWMWMTFGLKYLKIPHLQRHLYM